MQLEEGIGPVPVTLVGEQATPDTVWMRHRDAEFGPPLDNRAEISAALGLSEADLLVQQSICIGSTGLQFLYIPLRDPTAVDRAAPDYRAVRNALQGEQGGLFVFAPDPAAGAGRVYSRMFGGDSVGVSEDPATGSASGPLGAYVAERGVVGISDTAEIVSLQGAKMGRPSVMRIRLEMQDGHARNTQVGGGVVPILEGVLSLPTLRSLRRRLRTAFRRISA